MSPIRLNTMAQNVPFAQAGPYLEAFKRKVQIPQGYYFNSAKRVLVDDAPAYLFRYEKEENKGMNGEHFSFLVSEKDKQILGFTTMDKKYANPQMLSKDETKKTANEFLLKMDQTLLSDLENLWIKSHDEQITADTGQAATIEGMKYKCYRSSKDDYAWVIVGFDGSVITYERDIKWHTQKQRRITEKWLHDSWLAGKLSALVKKSALILIETQNEWMHTEGKLYKALVKDIDMMHTSIANIERAIAYSRKNNIEVIHVGLRYEKGYPELGNGKSGLRKAIANAGTFPINGFGSQFYETVKPLEGEFVATGRIGASGFSGSNLETYLRNNKIENLYLAGYATHVCVESTLRDAHDKGYNTHVVSDATSAFNRAQQQHVLAEVVHHFGEHLTTEEFINQNE